MFLYTVLPHEFAGVKPCDDLEIGFWSHSSIAWWQWDRAVVFVKMHLQRHVGRCCTTYSYMCCVAIHENHIRQPSMWWSRNWNVISRSYRRTLSKMLWKLDCRRWFFLYFVAAHGYDMEFVCADLQIELSSPGPILNRGSGMFGYDHLAPREGLTWCYIPVSYTHLTLPTKA